MRGRPGQHQVDPRHRPRRHRHAGAGREGAARGGHEPPGARARGVRASACGSGASTTGTRSSSSSSGSAPPATTPKSASRSTRATTAPWSRCSSRCTSKGWIYRDRYIVNWDPGSRSAISDLEVEERRETRHAVLDPLRPGGRRQRDDRHGAPGDDARRHRRGGAPRGRALPRAGRRARRSCRWSAGTCRSSPTST